MHLKSAIRRSFKKLRESVMPAHAKMLPLHLGAPSYVGDALCSWNKNMAWMNEPRFKKAYDLGMDTGHRFSGSTMTGHDIHLEWRVHTCCWAASHALQLEGDLVECGVNTGIMSRAICDYIDFNSTGRDFYLFDTYLGIPEEQMNKAEIESGRGKQNAKHYGDCFEIAKKNFSAYPRAHLVRGKVPETLTEVKIEKVAYLCIDMNIVYPEIAAMEFFWDKLVPGAVIVLDDYGWIGHYLQKEAIDEFLAPRNVKALTLPTGQGLIIKP
jgi:O-methyltransferase